MSLVEPHFRPYPITALSPRGWLQKQLRIQADGLSGNLDTFWPDIRDSAWIGGTAEGWERMPYWLDGVIPLAWLLDDQPLKARITQYLDTIIRCQGADGWLGPRVEEKGEAADLWSQSLALKMLVVYHDASGDERVPHTVERALHALDRRIDANPLSRWGQFRWFESLIAIWWLYDRNGDPWLLDLAVKLQAQGFDWQAFFRRWPLREPTEKGRWNFAGHVVNNAMALKQGGLWWRLTGDDADRNAPRAMLQALDRYHGMPTGVFSGDECLAGTSAIQGTELCAVAEHMYSMAWLAFLLGDTTFADRLEQIAFNALPATFTPDMWGHQYDQQVNQIECSVHENRSWNTNGPAANIFGLEPNYGCCTANLSQAWPKFAASLWARPAGGGIAAMAYAPSRLDTAIDGVGVSLQLATDYPFRQDLHFTVSTAEPVDFPLHVRIPAWVTTPTLEVDGAPVPVLPEAGFHTVTRTWQGETRIVLSLPMETRCGTRPNGAVSIHRGPLLYALNVSEDWRRVNADMPLRELPHGDWEVYPTTPWNYALETTEATLAEDIAFHEHPLETPLFAADHAPVTATVTGRRVPTWVAENGSATATPVSPVDVDGPSETLTLIPYGCSHFRIAEFPLVRGGG